jgi:hypothetical protein
MCVLASAGIAQRGDTPVIKAKYTKAFETSTMRIEAPRESPNGRFIAFAGFENALDPCHCLKNIWVLPRGSKTPVRVTAGQHVDEMPHWFPGSNRIAFRSNRLGGRLMTVDIDPKTGRPLGPPKRVTLDSLPQAGLGFSVAVSPDGREIAYGYGVSKGGPAQIRIVPAGGGEARTVYEARFHRLTWRVISWSKDGKYLYTFNSDSVPPTDRVVRIAVATGKADTLHECKQMGCMAQMDPAGLFYGKPAVRGGTFADSAPVYDFYRIADNSFIGRILVDPPDRRLWGSTMKGGARFVGFQADGSGLLALVQRAGTQVRSIDLRTGTPTVVADSAVTWGWVDDGRSVLLDRKTRTGIVHTIASATTRGKERPLKFSPDALGPELTGDGSTLYYGRKIDSVTAAIDVLNLARGTAREILRGPTADLDWRLTGSKQELVILRKQARNVELSVVAANGDRRVLRTFTPDAASDCGCYAVAGDKIAYIAGRTKTPGSKTAGDTTSVYLIRGAGDTPRRIAVSDGITAITWSPDGQWLLVVRRTDQVEHAYQVSAALIHVSATNTTPVTRWVELGERDVTTEWLPDSRGYTMLLHNVEHTESRVLFVPVTEGARPTNLTVGETEFIHWHTVSASGDRLLYEVPQQLPNSIWRADFGDLFRHPMPKRP